MIHVSYSPGDNLDSCDARMTTSIVRSTQYVHIQVSVDEEAISSHRRHHSKSAPLPRILPQVVSRRLKETLFTYIHLFIRSEQNSRNCGRSTKSIARTDQQYFFRAYQSSSIVSINFLHHQMTRNDKLDGRGISGILRGTTETKWNTKCTRSSDDTPAHLC